MSTKKELAVTFPKMVESFAKILLLRTDLSHPSSARPHLNRLDESNILDINSYIQTFPMSANSLFSSFQIMRHCPQCSSVRSISTAVRRLQVGPEHPRYVDIPEPPQQTAPEKPIIKGSLPVPRNIFSSPLKDQSTDEAIAQATRLPRKERTPEAGSREEWKLKMSHIRRQSLREGVKSLRVRQNKEAKRVRDRTMAMQRERAERLHRPEREDERLTAPSTTLDLKQLYSGVLPDPTRSQRLERKRLNIERLATEKHAERMDDLHTLYMNARDFIVTPEQLDKAVDEAFGTAEDPVTFGASYGTEEDQRSIWAEGRPQRVQDMLNRANRQSQRSALDASGGYTDITKDRIRKIAEKLTGGKMDA